jgi:hypothetical protein
MEQCRSDVEALYRALYGADTGRSSRSRRSSPTAPAIHWTERSGARSLRIASAAWQSAFFHWTGRHGSRPLQISERGNLPVQTRFSSIFRTVEVLTDPAPQPSTTRIHTIQHPHPQPSPMDCPAPTKWWVRPAEGGSRAGREFRLTISDAEVNWFYPLLWRGQGCGEVPPKVGWGSPVAEECVRAKNSSFNGSHCVRPAAGGTACAQPRAGTKTMGGLLKRRHGIVNFINIYLALPGATCRNQQSTIFNQLEEMNE